MTVKSVEAEENGRVALTIEIDQEPFAQAVDRAFRQNGKRMNVPGFRQGKAPRKMIEALYGEGVFYQDAVNDLCPEAVEEAIALRALEPVEKPDIEVSEVSKEGVTFVARFFTRPEALIENYLGLSVYKPPVSVEEADIDHELSHLRERNARMLESQAPAQDGDTLILDYEGFLGGEPFPGGKDTRATLVLGSNRFIPGFEEQLIGKKAGESCEVKVTFPEEYHAPDLAGREAVFQVLIHEVKTRELPALDDEFAKDVSEFDTLSALRDSIQKTILAHKEKDAEDEAERQLTDQIAALADVTVPEPMVEEQTNTFLQNLSYRLSAQGVDMGTYLQITGQSGPQVVEDMRRRAQKQVVVDLAFETIAHKENMEISEKELNDEFQKIAEENKLSGEQVREHIPAKSLTRDLLRLKAARFVREKALETSESPLTVDVHSEEQKEEQ